MTNTEFRDALASLGLSQRKLAERLGVETSTVNRWASEKATQRAPVPKYVEYILQLLREKGVDTA